MEQQSQSTMETRRTARRISINNRELIIAAGNGKHNLLEYYLKEGADVNFQDRDGNTALHWAVENGDLKAIELLIHHGATNLKNSQNETPMSLAERFNKLDALEMLECTLDSNIADVNFQDRDGNNTQDSRGEINDLRLIDSLIRNVPKYLKFSREEKPLSLRDFYDVFQILDTIRIRFDSNIQPSVSRLQMDKIQHSGNEVERNANTTSPLNIRNTFLYLSNLEARKNVRTHRQYQCDKRGSSMYGNIYQLKILMLFLKRGLSKKYSFHLGTETKEANKFDNLVFEYTQNNKKVYRLLQAKHKLDEPKKITAAHLLANNNGDYSLIKYFLSFDNCKRAAPFKNGTIKDVTVCTNIDFDFNSLESACIKVEKIESIDTILDVESALKLPVRYRFSNDVASLLQSNLKSSMHSLDEICDFLNHLVFAVNQPNEDELEMIIKQEIGKLFNFVTTEHVYSKLFMRMLNWLQGKEGGRYLSHEEGEQFFEEAQRGMPVLFDVKNPVKLFTGRTKELDDLHNMLQDKSIKRQFVCICGLGGVGKSELARKYIYVHSENYDNKIIWINAESYESLAESFRRLACNKLNMSTKNADGREQEMRSIAEDVYTFFINQRSLFVFDNAGTYECQNEFGGMEEFLPSLSSGGNMLQVLITSRNKKWPKHFKMLDLEAFNESDATDFLKSSFEMKNNSQMSDITNLAEMLGFMPLALKQAASYINVRDENLRIVGSQWTTQDYINAYQEKIKDFFNYPAFGRPDERYAPTVFATCHVTLDTIRQMEGGNNALEILNIASYLASEDIPMHLFTKLLPDPHNLESAISILSQYSLINVEDATFNIHRLVQEVIRFNIQAKSLKPEILGKALNLLTKDKIISNTISHAISVWNHSQMYFSLLLEFPMLPIYISHALLDNERYYEACLFGHSILEVMSMLVYKDISIVPIVLGLHQNIAVALIELGIYSVALQQLEFVLDKQKNLKLDVIDILHVKNTIAYILSQQAEYTKALKYYEEVSACENTLGLDDSVISRAKCGIAKVLVLKGKYAQGTQIFKDVLCTQEKKLEKRYWETIETKESLAKSLMEQGNLDESLKLLLEIHDARTHILCEPDHTTLQIMHNIGLVYFKKNDFARALQWYNDVISAAETAHGKLHQCALITRARVADVLRLQGKYNKALDLCRETSEKLSDSLGPRHADTIAAQFILGLIYDTRGDYNMGLKVFREVLHKRKLIFDNKHPDVLRTMKAIGHILIQQEKIDEAMQNIQQILDIEVEIQGENHICTLATKISLGILLRKQNNHVKALEVLHETLDAMERFHPHHKLIHTVREKIGLVYFAQNKHDDALKILRDVLRYREATLGKDNLETVATKGHLVDVLIKEQKTIEALKLVQEMHAVYNEVFGPTGVRTLKVAALIRGVLKLQNHDLLIAVRTNDTASVQKLVNDGRDVNSTGNDGGSLLHYAVNNNNIRILNFLLEKGADIMQVTKKGNTPLHIAVSKGLLDIVEVLLKFSKHHELSTFVDVRTTASGSSALHVAAKNGSLEIVTCLLRNGATYNIKDNKNNIPLTLSKDQNVAKLLQLTEELFGGAKCGNVGIIDKLRRLSYDTLLAVTNARSECKTIMQVCIINNYKNIAEMVLQILQDMQSFCGSIKY